MQRVKRGRAERTVIVFDVLNVGDGGFGIMVTLVPLSGVEGRIMGMHPSGVWPHGNEAPP